MSVDIIGVNHVCAQVIYWLISENVSTLFSVVVATKRMSLSMTREKLQHMELSTSGKVNAAS